jgi:hypothetical protein
LADELYFLDVLVGTDFDLGLEFGDLLEDLLFKEVQGVDGGDFEVFNRLDVKEIVDWGIGFFFSLLEVNVI